MISRRSVILTAVLCAAATVATAQGPSMGQGPGGPGMGKMDHRGMRPGGPGGAGKLLPPGTWWRDQSTVTAIGLSADQQKKIDGIFLESRVQLIHMHASLEEDQVRLDDTLSAPTLDAAKAQKQIDEAADTRASLEKAEAHMLLTIRGVLTADQWTKLQSLRPHGRGPEGPQGPGHMGKRGPGHGGPMGAPPQGGPGGQPGPQQGNPPPPEDQQ